MKRAALSYTSPKLYRREPGSPAFLGPLERHPFFLWWKPLPSGAVVLCGIAADLLGVPVDYLGAFTVTISKRMSKGAVKIFLHRAQGQGRNAIFASNDQLSSFLHERAARILNRAGLKIPLTGSTGAARFYVKATLLEWCPASSAVTGGAL